MTPLDLTLDGDTGIVATRRFRAPPARIYEAHINPDLVRKWMLGPEGWTMPVCEYDARPGGAFMVTWASEKEGTFSVSGAFIELDPPHRIVHVERFHMPDPTPDNRIETLFEADGDGTLMTMRMQLPDKEARDALIATGMAEGMEHSYARLDGAVL